MYALLNTYDIQCPINRNTTPPISVCESLIAIRELCLYLFTSLQTTKISEVFITLCHDLCNRLWSYHTTSGKVYGSLWAPQELRR